MTKKNIMNLRITILFISILFWGTIHVQAKKDKVMVSEKQPDYSLIKADSLKAKASYYFWQFRYQDALNNYFKALKIYEQLNDKKNIGSTYTGIAYVYADMNSYIQAEKYVNKALVLASELDDTLCLAHSYNIMKKIRFAERKWDECLEYVMHEEDYFAFTVYDNGCGFVQERQTKGTGLPKIRERIAAYNGRFEIVTSVGEGTEINVELKIES